MRKYLDKRVESEKIEKIIEAAICAPSAAGKQARQFILIDERKLLQQIPQINKNAWMASECQVAILVCGDKKRNEVEGYWSADCAAACENILLAVHALGLSAVWTAAYPREERIEGYRKLLSLPEHIVPYCLIPIGYSDGKPEEIKRVGREEVVHKNGWQVL